MSDEYRLPHDVLRWKCDEGCLPFMTTEELPDLAGSLGQDKALRAIELGLRMDGDGFNIFVVGGIGTGRSTTIMNMLRQKATARTAPEDWCYVHNFENPDMPLSLKLPNAMSTEFSKDMEELVDVMRHDIPKALDSKEYDSHRNRIIEEHRTVSNTFFQNLEMEAQQHDFAMQRTVSGLSFIPKRDGQNMTQEEFEALPLPEREELEKKGQMLTEKLADVMRQVRELEKDSKEAMGKLDRDLALGVIGHHIDPLKEKYAFNPKICHFLDTVQNDIIENIDDFKTQEAPQSPFPGIQMPTNRPSFDRYRVNILINNSALQGAPVVYESNPTYHNMFGRIELMMQPNGGAISNFTLVKSGALHRANGGYLVIDARAALVNPFVWESLKRAIKNSEIRIEDITEQYRFATFVALKPEPIPLQCKIILIGTPDLYHLLFELEPEYRKLFKIKAEFETRIPRNDETMQEFAQLVATHCRSHQLLPFDRSAVGRLMEHSARLTEHQNRLSCQTLEVADIMQEAHVIAAMESAVAVDRRHVAQALEDRRNRNNRIEERMQEFIDEGTIFVDTTGRVAGQINGLAVMMMGDHAFGRPSRITARVWSGRGGTVNIEREAKLSGPIHDKGVLVLSAYLAGRFSRPKARPFNASVCFEQSYNGVDGDSASSTELYAILSALSGVPIRQGIAVTGSVNQLGYVQPIGGVNEKVEGFYQVCKSKGLTGDQGVMIPKSNERNLMLSEEVVQAVAEGKFHIWSVATIEEGIEVLTGVPAGMELEPGVYEEGSILQLAAKNLDAMQPSEDGIKPPDQKQAAG